MVFPVPGGAAEDGVHRGSALKGRPEKEGELLASRWWRCSGTKVCSKTSGLRKRVWSLRRSGEYVIEESGEGDGDKGWSCAARKWKGGERGSLVQHDDGAGIGKAGSYSNRCRSRVRGRWASRMQNAASSTHKRSAILNVLPGNPLFVKGVQENSNLRVVAGYMPHCGNETGVAPFDVACSRNARTLWKALLYAGIDEPSRTPHRYVLLRHAKEPRRGCERTGETLHRSGVGADEAPIDAFPPPHRWIPVTSM